jgi:hypothetical protein
MPQVKMPVPVLLILTVGPAILIGATLWMANSLIPACTVAETARVTAPDTRFDLVTFSRDCGDTIPNTQAALVPPGETVPFDAASFFSVTASADLQPRWTDNKNLELTLPTEGDVFRQDETVAGVTVTYR